jgi:hypothetical protein
MVEGVGISTISAQFRILNSVHMMTPNLKTVGVFGIYNPSGKEKIVKSIQHVTPHHYRF